MRNVLKTTLVVLLSFFALVGCTDSGKNKNASKEQTEENTAPMSDDYEIVEVKTGWRYSEPIIRIKIRNVSGKAITETIHVKYDFIYKDEIIDGTSTIIHGSSDMAWDNGLCKTIELKSFTAFQGIVYNNVLPDVRARVMFEDNSPIWDGEISKKFIVN